MHLTNKGMMEEALKRLELLQDYQRAVLVAVGYVNNRRGAQHPSVDSRELMAELYKLELDEWRGIFMWGLTLEPAEQERIKAIAHQKFLSDKSSVAEWFNDKILPSEWLSADEDRFREMARQAFKPKKVK